MEVEGEEGREHIIAAHWAAIPFGHQRAALDTMMPKVSLPAAGTSLRQAGAWAQGMLADVSIATGWMTIALMLTGRFVFQVSVSVVAKSL